MKFLLEFAIAHENERIGRRGGGKEGAQQFDRLFAGVELPREQHHPLAREPKSARSASAAWHPAALWANRAASTACGAKKDVLPARRRRRIPVRRTRAEEGGKSIEQETEQQLAHEGWSSSSEQMGIATQKGAEFRGGSPTRLRAGARASCSRRAAPPAVARSAGDGRPARDCRGREMVVLIAGEIGHEFMFVAGEVDDVPLKPGAELRTTMFADAKVPDSMTRTRPMCARQPLKPRAVVLHRMERSRAGPCSYGAKRARMIIDAQHHHDGLFQGRTTCTSSAGGERPGGQQDHEKPGKGEQGADAASSCSLFKP